MKRTALRRIGLMMVLMGVLLSVMVQPALATVPGKGSQFDLVSDKSDVVGWVSVVHQAYPNPPGNLLVTYHLFPTAWRLQSVEVAVSGALTASGDFDGLPVNRQDNPVPGWFAWKPLVPAGATEYTVVIPVTQTDLSGGDYVYFAAHAKLTNGLKTTGAWAHQYAFPDSHNGGEYFIVSCTN